jgi:predicted PurR-regulated permease PerM
MNGNKFLKGIVTFLIACGVLFLIWYLSRVVIYIIISAVLAIMGRGLVQLLSRLKIFGRDISRGMAAAFTLIVIWCVAGALCALFLPPVMDKIHQLAQLEWEGVARTVQAALVDVQVMLQRLLDVEFNDVAETIKEYLIKDINIDYLSTFSNIISLLTSSFIALFSISFITFYFLKEDGLFYRLVALFFPDRYRTNVFHALDSVTALLSRYFGGLLVESLVLLTIISITMMICGMAPGDALVIGLIIGVMNVIPYAGPFIGCMLSLVIGIITPINGDVSFTAIAIVSTIVVVKLIDDFIIQPTLYSDRVQAHPLEVFLVILIAGYVGGIWGMLLAIPLYTVFRVFAREFFSEYGLVRRLTGQMTK